MSAVCCYIISSKKERSANPHRNSNKSQDGKKTSEVKEKDMASSRDFVSTLARTNTSVKEIIEKNKEAFGNEAITTSSVYRLVKVV